MQILCDATSIQKALATQAELARLIATHVEIISQYQGYDLSDLVQFVVMASGETSADLDRALGYPDTVVGNEEPEFVTSWETLDEYQYWFELVFVRGDDGEGIVVYVVGCKNPSEPSFRLTHRKKRTLQPHRSTDRVSETSVSQLSAASPASQISAFVSFSARLYLGCRL